MYWRAVGSSRRRGQRVWKVCGYGGEDVRSDDGRIGGGGGPRADDLSAFELAAERRILRVLEKSA